MTQFDPPTPNLPLLRKVRIFGMTERFWEQVQAQPNGCVLWTGRVVKGGYGVYRHYGKMQLVHRAIWEEMVGPIPDGLTLDHVKEVCGNPACINVNHLEVVTLRVNVQRAQTQATCNQGHEFDAIRPNGKRYCKTCSSALAAAWRARNLEACRAYQAAWARSNRTKQKAESC